MRASVLHKQRKQSRRIRESKKVLELWFRIKSVKGTFVPSISPNVNKVASLNHGSMDSSPIMGNLCSTVFTITVSVLLRLANVISIMFEVV